VTVSAPKNSNEFVVSSFANAFVYRVAVSGDWTRDELLARIKQPFSKAIKQILVEHRSHLLNSLTVRERPGKFCFRFWQKGSGFDRNRFTAEAVKASIDYIPSNPVKRGLCNRAVD